MTTWTAVITAAPTPGTRTVTLDHEAKPSWPAIGDRITITLIDDHSPTERTDLPTASQLDIDNTR